MNDREEQAKVPALSYGQKPLSDELRERSKRTRREFKSEGQLAREEVLLDWIGAPRPLDEKRGVESLANILVRLMPRWELKEEGMTQAQLREGWMRAAGDFIATNAELVKIERGEALVRVLQPTLRYHLSQYHAPLLEKLQQEFGVSLVRTVKFIFG